MEQLHYTWASRGTEGINRLQIAAISAGLRSSSTAPLLPAIRKVCRYERPPGGEDRLPVSFGWFEHRRRLIAFSRVGLPQSRVRRGNFAAHVLVAAPEELSGADVASTFGAPFWWTGYEAEAEEEAAAERGFELPPVEREQLLAGRVEPPPEVTPPALALSHGLLTLPAEKRLAVVDGGGEFGPALRVVAWRLPEALTGISLSTYEGSAPGFAFRVIGTAGRLPRSVPCDLRAADSLEPADRLLLEQLLGTEPGHAALRAAIRPTAAAGGGAAAARGTTLWSAARALTSMAAEQRPADGQALRALTTPDAIVHVCDGPAGAANVAEATWVGGDAVHRALGSAWPRLRAGTRDALLAALTERCLAARDLGGIAAVAEALPDSHAADRLVDGALDAALTDGGRSAESLRGEDAALLIGRVVARRRRRGGLSEAERNLCVVLLGRAATPQLEAALPPLLPALATADRAGAVEGLLARLSAPVAARCLLQATGTRRLPAEATAVLGRFCDAYAAALAGRGAVPLALQLLGRSGTRDGSLAAELLGAATRGSTAAAAFAARRAGEIERADLREAVAERAMDRAVEVARSPDEVDAIWDALARAHPGAEESELLRRLLERVERRPGAGGAAVLAWAASSLLPDHSKLLRRGALRDSEAQEIACRVAGRLSPWQLSSGREGAKKAGRRYGAWWKGLETHKRKRARR